VVKAATSFRRLTIDDFGPPYQARTGSCFPNICQASQDVGKFSSRLVRGRHEAFP
jgi:hypothetical protein